MLRQQKNHFKFLRNPKKSLGTRAHNGNTAASNNLTAVFANTTVVVDFYDKGGGFYIG